MRVLILTLTCAVAWAQADRVFQNESEVTAIAVGKGGNSLAAFSRDGKIRLWDVKTGKSARTIDRTEGDGAPVFLAAQGTYAVASANGYSKVRNWEDGGEIRAFELPSPRPGSPASTLDGKVMAASGRDPGNASANLMRVWDDKGKQKFQVPAGIGGVSSIVFSPDGETLVSAAYDTDLRVWSARNGELKKVIDSMLVAMFDLAFSPDGKYLAAAGVDRTIYLWDTKTWTVVKKITGQPELISALEFSPDGKMLVTGGMNAMAFTAPVKVMLWDIASGKAIRTVDAEHRVTSVAFSPDAKWFAAADGSKNIRLWAVPSR